MSHAEGGPSAVVMRRPDGTPMTRDEVVRERRGAFKWLPVVFSNDLVHGSWYILFTFYMFLHILSIDFK